MPSLPSFHVRNLGPIAEGTVGLHPLTILIGKNNTGKTYMAQAIYAAYKALERANGPVQTLITIDESDELLRRLHVEAERGTDVLHGTLRQKADEWIRSRLDRAGQLLGDRLTVYFDLEDLSELRRWKANGQLEVSVSIDLSGAESTFLFGLGRDDSVSRVQLPTVTANDFKDSRISDMLSTMITGLPDEDIARHNDIRRHRASSLLADFLWNRHLLPSFGLDGSVHYLPAGRSGLLEAWTDVVRLRLEQDREGLALTGREPAALGGIALDFLLELQELTRPSRGRNRLLRSRHGRRGRSGDIDSAARHLEELIDGEVAFARGRERVPSLTYTHGNKSIPVQRASSMVAELAPLLSWIEHLLSPGDLILIDEPEAHMHPEAVLAVAQTLVSLSRSGVRILCTTHSSEFLHQVSNCMLRSTSQSRATRTGPTSIEVSDIGVYRFESADGSSGTRIVSVDIDPAWGIPEDEHVAVAERLAEETASLVAHRK